MSKLLRTLAVPCTLTAAFATAGCDNVFDLGPESRSLVQVLVTHHGTPQNGSFPDNRSSLGNQQFDNDEGWTVTLLEAFVVTADVALQACDGGEVALQRYWGALPEDLGSVDLALLTFGGADVSPGQYCGVTVTYAPYVPTPHQTDAEAPQPEISDAVMGASVYITGHAKRGDTVVPFEIRSEERLVTEATLGSDGTGPLNVSGDEAFPLELTVAKTYDRFFDGVDFATMPNADLENNLLALLGLQTRLVAGTVVPAQ